MSGTGNTARNNVALTGNASIDSLLTGDAWVGAITYSFPATNAEYGSNYAFGNDDAPYTDFMAMSAAQQTAFEFALDADVGPAAQAVFSVEGFTNVDISLTTAANATIRGAQSSEANPTAYAYTPATGFSASGDVWFGDNIDYRNPVMGDYSFHTHLHEIGHALGLEHSHEGNISPLSTEHAAYTVMSYRAFEGAELTGYTYETFGAPQTFMQMDIAALQHMYGADYTSNSGNTTYTWTPGSSDTVIDNVIALNPGGDVIFATIWDGGGTDTYDLSAYATDMRIDVSAGGYSLFDINQASDLGPGQTADGNIYNALMFQGNQASLIENAIGGSGDDLFIGNQADNNFNAGSGVNTISFENDDAGVTVNLATSSAVGTEAGTDVLTGFVNAIGGDGDDGLTGTGAANDLVGGYGADTLIGGAGDDTLNGGLNNFVASLPSAIGTGSGTYVRAANTGNTSLATAVNLDNLFALTADADIINATTVPHVSISASGDANEAIHYYAVTLNIVGSTATFDLDYGQQGTEASPLAGDMDSWIEVFDANGVLVALNDDIDPGAGANGSVSSLDSLVSFTNESIGVFTVAVGSYFDGSAQGNVPNGGTYELQVSVEEGTPVANDSGSDILEGGAGNDTLEGGDGIDYAQYTGGTRADYVETENPDGTYTVVAFGTQGTDTLSNIEYLRIDGVDYALGAVSFGFTQGNDDIDGTAADDVMNGLGGDDIIRGLGGNDIISGGDGVDRLFGGEGLDTLSGGDGDDYLYGGEGADALIGGAGLDRAYYTDSTAGLTVNIINPNLNTGIATGDTYDSIEAIYGSAFDDILTSGNDNNNLIGNNGNDTLIGAGGRDNLFGGNGNDRLLGGLGDDVMQGNAGIDTYVLQAGAGSDRIFTYEVGIDIIQYVGGPGEFADLTITQVGAHTVIDSIVGSLRLISTQASDITADAFSFINPLPDATGVSVTDTLTAGNDTFVGGADNNIINGLAGVDNLTGGIGDDTLNGGDGNDTLTGGLGADVLNGGDGIDRVNYSTASAGVTINAFDTSLNTGEAAGDTYISIENFQGSNGDDNITSGGDGNRLVGLGGDDILIGAGGNDLLFGGNDDDRLLGGTGNDQLHGQGGADTYVIRANAGNDTIYDFGQGEDIIEFNGTAAGFSELTITQVGETVTIVWNGDVSEVLTVRSLTATPVTAADFTAADFTFANIPASGQGLSSKAGVQMSDKVSDALLGTQPADIPPVDSFDAYAALMSVFDGQDFFS